MAWTSLVVDRVCVSRIIVFSDMEPPPGWRGIDVVGVLVARLHPVLAVERQVFRRIDRKWDPPELHVFPWISGDVVEFGESAPHLLIRNMAAVGVADG